jgi:DNA polymerase I-like protein with 3'-5' exonuclease and polymerase domains
MALIFDIETDGFEQDATKIHCLVIKDTETGELIVADSDHNNLEPALKLLTKGDLVAGHNVIRFDIPVIQRLYPWFSIDQSKVVDTLVLSRLLYSDLRERDGGNVEAGRLPTKLWASHSLKAWGYRMEMLKGEYGDEEGAWEVFTPEMLEYCIRDVDVTEALYKKLIGSDYSAKAIELEHKAAWACASMSQSGWPFDKEKAVSLYADLVAKREAIKSEMMATFEPLVIKRISEKTGKPLKDKIIEFNPGSRDQIAQRLITKYGWDPKDFTPGGKAKVDEDVLKGLDYPEAKTLAEYFLIDKRVGQLAEGDQAWLKLERNGKIHGSINTNGAITGRCTHQSPNMAQVPGVQSPYGSQCRELFTVPQGFKMVGCDLSGLELRCLAHFMAQWDGGDYAKELLTGDIHTANQKAAGLETRAQAKTFIYGFLYGAGDEKIGSIVGKGREEGAKLRKKFLEATPALKNLRAAVGNRVKERGYLTGLDGRRLSIRSEHAALNTLLQSAGALISKQWLIECFEETQRRNHSYGWDGQFTLLGYIHDELQWAVREEIADYFGTMVVDCAHKAGEFFNFRVPIDAEYKVGANWADTH